MQIYPVANARHHMMIFIYFIYVIIYIYITHYKVKVNTFCGYKHQEEESLPYGALIRT